MVFLKHFKKSQTHESITSSSPTPPANEIKDSTSYVNNPSKGKRTCIYYSNWSIYERKHYPNDIPLDYVTNIFFAFANINSDTGNVYSSDEWADFNYELDPLPNYNNDGGKIKGLFGKFIEIKTKYPHIKTSLSIGGWSNRDNFTNGLNTTKKLDEFINSTLNLIFKYKFDGIDLDWEYPNNIEEANIYLKLIKLFRIQLRNLEEKLCLHKDTLLLTIASPAFDDKLSIFPIQQMDKYLSFWNLMTYDFSGEWSETCGYHCNLYKKHSINNNYNNCENNVDELCGDDAINYLISKGVPSNKIILGMANYGRSFINTKGYGEKFKGVGKGSSDEDGIWNYKYLPGKFKEHYDSNAVVAYIYDSNAKLFISYDNVESIKTKAQYVKRNNLGGGMWWESCGDSYQDPKRCLLINFVEELGGLNDLDKSLNILSMVGNKK
ncbi:hypothetical protein WICMUC_003377 [Wickerhamomyces mucosus]|uniref:chitinase n=1 Tax=Wickerhamomyces mucosus TaxID=1378264 RepID=A0A9P8PLP9_9ASCO|nr:hypothetical protein WICMUC_003377 [Wickerhamomyces mucosus]